MKEKHKKRFFALSAVIFSLMAIGHGLRLYYDLEVKIGFLEIPVSVSVLAVIGALGMAVMSLWYLKSGV